MKLAARITRIKPSATLAVNTKAQEDAIAVYKIVSQSIDNF